MDSIPATGTCILPQLDGCEIKPGVLLIGEPTPVPGTDKLRCLANVLGMLCVVELSIKFAAPGDDSDHDRVAHQPR